MLAPRRAYLSAVASAKADAALAQAPGAYILYYVLVVSLLVAAAAAWSATGRITVSQLLGLGLSWMFLPLLHVAVAGALVSSAREAKVRGNRAIGLLLLGHAPWSLWLIVASAATGLFGYALYFWMLVLALVPIALTFRILHAYCVEVLGTTGRGATVRALAHQAITWLIAAIYLDRAVALVPRIQGWLS